MNLIFRQFLQLFFEGWNLVLFVFLTCLCPKPLNLTELCAVMFAKLCGPVRSWKRPQDPTNGSLKGFGFCEFESAEGVLRALRLLNKLNIDGQELLV